MDRDPKSPLKILKRDVAKGFTASFLKRQKKKADVAKQKDTKPTKPQLEYQETKEAIEAVTQKTFVSRITHSIRDFFWNYPKYFEQLIKSTRPISLLILYAAIFIGVWEGLQYFTREKALALTNIQKLNQRYL